MNFSLIAHFIAVARAGSFIAAARELNATPSVITRSIQKLEEVVGAALFERTTRHVRLTPAGRAFLMGAEEGVARLTTAAENARRVDQAQVRLRIAICPSAEPALAQVALGLRVFNESWPEAHVQLRSIPRKAQPEALRAAEVEVGIMRLSAAECAGLEWRVIASHPLAVFVPAFWGLEGDRIELQALKDRPWILPDPDLAPGAYRFHVGLCRRAGFEPKLGALSGTGDWYSGRVMVASGMGAAFGPRLDPPGPLMRGLVLEGISNDYQPQTAMVWAPGAPSPLRDALLALMNADNGED